LISGCYQCREGKRNNYSTEFYEKGEYFIKLYEDKTGEELTNINIRNLKVKNSEQLKVKMAKMVVSLQSLMTLINLSVINGNVR
jgi:hypothetical protein